MYLLAGCGPQRKNPLAKFYHNTTAYFNRYYHAHLNYEWGVKQVEQTEVLPTDGFLPLVTIVAPENATAARIYFDTAISKNDVLIYKHPNSRWVDNARFLTGRCHYYLGNYPLAQQNFNYVLFQYPDSKLKPEVQMWLARTYYVAGNAYRANELINQLDPDEARKRRVRREIAELKATMLVSQKKYNEALATLQQSYGDVQGKTRKARWLYLQAQLYDQLGDLARAYEHYDRAARMNAETQLTFQARLRLAGLYTRGQAATPDQVERVRGMLTKLLKDSKYSKFRDQIYYQLALLDANNGKPNEALNNLRLSLASSTNNTRQRALSYYQAGQIFFYQKQDFFNAQAYYDSAATVTQEGQPEYEQIKRMATTLGNFVTHYNTVKLQDSLLKLSTLTEAEQNAAAERVIAAEETERVRREAEARELQRQMQQFNANLDPNQNTDPFATSSSSFYFADQNQINRGKNEFARIWGTRPNEDHWRRRNKMMLASVVEEVEDTLSADPEEARRQRVAKLTRNIPKTEAQRDSAHRKVQESLYELGNLYGSKFNLPDSAIVVFNRLLQRYPTCSLVPKTHYALYTVCKTHNNPQCAQLQKSILLERYATTQYARLINNEAVPAEDEASNRAFNNAYSTLRNMYDANDCETVVNFGDALIREHLSHPEVYRMQFLRGSCFGTLGQRDSLKAVYEYLVSAYPNTDLTPIAKRTLELLASGNTARPDSARPNRPDSSNTAAVPIAGFNVQQQENENVYVLMFVEKTRARTTELNNLVSDFHRATYPNDGLRASVFTTNMDGTDYHMVYVSQFRDYPTAEAYMRVARQHGPLRALMASPDDDVVFCTPGNFRVAFAQKRFADYKKFVKQNYQQLLDNGSRGGQ